jgi:large subunit ribosomal protein L4
MKLEVYNILGEKTGREIELPEEVFGCEPHEHSLYLAVKQYRNNQRMGLHKTKGRSEVKGSTRKIKKQKGTGTARAGDIKNPLFRGGGRMFGPQPRDYGISLNKKVKQLAQKSAFSVKARENELLVVEDFTFDAPKTKEFKGILQKLGLEGKKTLLVTSESDNVLYLSGRNIPNNKLATANTVNVYELLDSNAVILSESSIELLKKRLS